MFEGRALVHPLPILLGARAVDRPGVGYALVASVLVPFELETGRLAEPARWCQAVAVLGAGAGAAVPPDSMAPLTGAELLVLAGPEPLREGPVDVACGPIEVRLSLRKTGDGGIDTGPRGAAWCEGENEWGRRNGAPSMVDRARPERPVWLGPTPPDHPARLALAGDCAAGNGTRWGRGRAPRSSTRPTPRSGGSGSSPATPSASRG